MGHDCGGDILIILLCRVPEAWVISVSDEYCPIFHLMETFTHGVLQHTVTITFARPENTLIVHWAPTISLTGAIIFSLLLILETSHEGNMSAGPATGWRQVQQSFPMNSDLARAVYIKCRSVIGFTLQAFNSVRSRPTGRLGPEGSNHCWAKRGARTNRDIKPLIWFYHPEEVQDTLWVQQQQSITQQQFLFFFFRHFQKLLSITLLAWLY